MNWLEELGAYCITFTEVNIRFTELKFFLCFFSPKIFMTNNRFHRCQFDIHCAFESVTLSYCHYERIALLGNNKVMLGTNILFV